MERHNLTRPGSGSRLGVLLLGLAAAYWVTMWVSDSITVGGIRLNFAFYHTVLLTVFLATAALTLRRQTPARPALTALRISAWSWGAAVIALLGANLVLEPSPLANSLRVALGPALVILIIGLPLRLGVAFFMPVSFVIVWLYLVKADDRKPLQGS